MKFLDSEEKHVLFLIWLFEDYIFRLTAHLHLLLTEQPVGQWWKRQQSSSCVLRPCRGLLLTTCKPSMRASDSHGEGMTQAPHAQSCTCVLLHKQLCACVENKAGCLLFTGCGSRLTSMCSLSEDGRGIKKKCGSVEKGDQHRGVVLVRLLHTWCSSNWRVFLRALLGERNTKNICRELWCTAVSCVETKTCKNMKK